MLYIQIGKVGLKPTIKGNFTGADAVVEHVGAVGGLATLLYQLPHHLLGRVDIQLLLRNAGLAGFGTEIPYHGRNRRTGVVSEADCDVSLIFHGATFLSVLSWDKYSITERHYDVNTYFWMLYIQNIKAPKGAHFWS